MVSSRELRWLTNLVSLLDDLIIWWVQQIIEPSTDVPVVRV